MTPPVGAGRCPRLSMLTPIVGGVVAFALALWGLSTLFMVPGEDGPSTVVAEPSAGEAFVTAPAAQVRRVHEAMHDIAARCQPGVAASEDTRRELDRDVEVILVFARGFPDARLQIDDESGRTLSLLLGVRDDLRRCAPTVAGRLDPAIPPPYRQQPAGSAPS
jgi:hypothetical protein